MNLQEAIVDGLWKGIRKGFADVFNHGRKKEMSGKTMTMPEMTKELEAVPASVKEQFAERVKVNFNNGTGNFEATVNGELKVRRRRRDLVRSLTKKGFTVEYDYNTTDNP